MSRLHQMLSSKQPTVIDSTGCVVVSGMSVVSYHMELNPAIMT